MIKQNLRDVLENIETAKHNRPSNIIGDVLLVAVTKNHSVEQMQEAIDNGVTDIGENRIQEALEKFSALDRNVTKHLIGHLQTNKVKQAVKHFDLIHSVDSQRLAQAVDRAAQSLNKVQDVLVQINLAREESKSGVDPDQLDELLSTVKDCTNLKLKGLMLIAPNYEQVEQCRPLFRQMYRLFQRQKEIYPTVEYLSMGMTHDYKIAVEEGANLVRIGTAIFGARDYR
ncbi:MAG: YggS family pyridoxal phosphate-dependent enzyme [Selenomonadaceae bacterium]|nr:YggS family pyridoxal phosphate-dependent enzyme [Selenomonadaceae bacterium]